MIMKKFNSDFAKIFYKNRNGEITIFQIIILIIAFSLLLLTTITSKIERAQLQEQNNKILCSRAYTSSLKKIRSYIQQTNKLIATAKLAKVATIFIPGAGSVAVANGEAVKALKMSQELAINAFISQQILKSKQCGFQDVAQLSPIKTKHGKIERNKLEQAEFKPKIEFEYLGKNFSTQIKIEMERFPKKGSVWIYLKDKKGVWSLTSSLPFS
jgi:hypothetical protein